MFCKCDDFYSLMDKTIKSHTPITINHNNKNVVMLNEEGYLSICETLYLKSDSNFTDELVRRKNDPKSEFVDDIGIQ
ncbi:MAG: prevent-host-death family protein [Gammaproteobacteria bacterium]|nr:MAG: prevent-host-death family protein [Gammaproteobacteria bacterium]